MAARSVKEEIISVLEHLTPEQQRQVLEFTQRMTTRLSAGTPGEVLMAAAREVNFDPADLEEMQQAIEEGCERIDWDGWR